MQADSTNQISLNETNTKKIFSNNLTSVFYNDQQLFFVHTMLPTLATFNILIITHLNKTYMIIT